MSTKFKFWDNLEYILGLTALISLFLLIYLNMSQELHDPDIWLHLKVGEYIIQQKSIPKIDIFSSTMSGKVWIDHSWLVQVIFYLVFHFGGPDNLILLSAILVSAAFLILFFTVYKQRRHLALSVALLFITILASRIRFNIRPENFSILFFALYLFLLKRQINKKWLFLLVLLQLIWVNCHGFFILGPLLVAVFILTEMAKKTGRLPWEWSRTEALDRRSLRNLLRLFPLVCAVCLVNPYGYKGTFYPLKITFETIGKSSIFYKYIIELLPTWHLSYPSISIYYVLVAISGLAFLLTFKRINLTSLMLWLIFLGLSFRVSRNILYFNFIAFVTTAEILTKGLNLKIAERVDKFWGKSIYLLKYATIGVIILWALRLDYSILKARYYVFEEDYSKSVLLGISAKGYPEKAVNFILDNDLPGNIFNLFNYGSYLIYRLFPQKKVFIDGRTELYGEDFFKSLQKIMNLDKETIGDLFNKYAINTVLLSGDLRLVGTLGSYFLQEPGWSLVFFDPDSVIFLRNRPQNKMLIEKLKIDLKNWQVPEADLDKLGIRNIFPEPYVRRAWIFYYLGLYEQAIQEVKEALRILPSSADAYSVMARIYTEQGKYDRAFENVRLSYIYGPSRVETLISLGNWYSQTGKAEQAIKVYKKLTKLNPYFAQGYYLLGLSYKQINNSKLAIKSLRTAIKLNPFAQNYYKELEGLLSKSPSAVKVD